MSTQARLIRTVVKRLERLERIRALMAAEFEFTGNRKMRVRRDEVVACIAGHIAEQVSPKLRLGVQLLAKQLGWAPVSNGNRRQFAGVKRRGRSDAEALETSAVLRRRCGNNAA